MKKNIKNFSHSLLFLIGVVIVFLVRDNAFGQQEIYYSLQPYMTQSLELVPEKEVFPKEIQEKKLQIGIFQNPPFSFQKEDGTWGGIAVDIIKKIALDNNLQYEFKPILRKDQPFSLEDLKDFDFSQFDIILWSVPDVILKSGYSYDYSLPYYIGGIAVVQKKVPTTFIDMFIQGVSSKVFLSSCALLGFFIFVGTVLIWLFERESKLSPFRKDLKLGLWDSFWWCTSVTTTVFPCELFPKSVAGRSLAIVWMFLSMTFFLGFIGTLSSSLTVNKMKTPVQELRDLSSAKVLVVKNSSTEVFLKNNMISYRTVDSIEAGLDKVQREEESLFVGPEPLVRYYLNNNNNYEKLIINPLSFSTQYYSFIVPLGSTILHPLNYEILRIINSYFWKKILFEYMGHIPTIH